MKNIFLKQTFKKDRFRFYQQQLFDESRSLKKWVSILCLLIFAYDALQSQFLLPRQVVYSSGFESVFPLVLFFISLVSYYFSIFKFFEKKNPKIYTVRYFLLVLCVTCLSGGMFLKGYCEMSDRVESNDIEKWYYSLLKARNEAWLVLLSDILIPIWYIKLLIPSSLWVVQIYTFYQKELEYPSMLWTCFTASTIFTAGLWGIKAQHEWQMFKNRMNIEAWDGVHRYILDKVPDSIAVIDENCKVIYSNSNFQALCENDLNNLSKKLVGIRKSEVDFFTNLYGEKLHREPTAQEDRPTAHGYREDSQTYLNFFELIETLILPLAKGVLTINNYLVFNAKENLSPASENKPRSYQLKIGGLLEYGKVILILSDTTQRDLALSFETVNHYKDKLLATVSHDLRAPINGSIAFLEQSIHHEEVPGSIKEQFLVPALRSCKFLLHLVNDILDFSQINAQKLRMNFEAASLIDTIKNCFQLLEMQANFKNINLSLVLDDKLPSKFTTDHNRLSQVIINLLTNAIKFTFKGGVTLSAKVVQDSSLIEIKVTDTGIGIKQTDMEKLFQEDFTRIEYEKKGINPRGVGLGLVIANNLAKKLGPNTNKKEGINSASVYGEGSAFWFLIEDKKVGELYTNQLVRGDSYKLLNKSVTNSFLLSGREEDFLYHKIDEADSSNSKFLLNSICRRDFTVHRQSVLSPRKHIYQKMATSPQRSQYIGKVLIVDDDPLNILALRSLLKQYGINADTAFNGKEAIEKIFQNQDLEKNLRTNEESEETAQMKGGSPEKYGLIFMDCEMPVMDGFETTKKLSAMMKNGEVKTTPIVGCTGYQETMAKECFESGMIGVICKPPKLEKLIDLLEKYFIKSV